MNSSIGQFRLVAKLAWKSVAMLHPCYPEIPSKFDIPDPDLIFNEHEKRPIFNRGALMYADYIRSRGKVGRNPKLKNPSILKFFVT